MTGPGQRATVQARGQYMDKTSAKLMLGEGARDAHALLSIYPVTAISKDLCVHPGLSLPPEGSVLVLSIPEARQLRTAGPRGRRRKPSTACCRAFPPMRGVLPARTVPPSTRAKHREVRVCRTGMYKCRERRMRRSGPREARLPGWGRE